MLLTWRCALRCACCSSVVPRTEFGETPNRDVAIKIATVEFSERSAREARLAAALNHVNICRIYAASDPRILQFNIKYTF